MEDAVAITPTYNGNKNHAIFSIFDGHYGKRCANFASKHLHTHMATTQATRIGATDATVEALKGGFEGFDKWFLEHNETQNWEDGSTALTMFIQADKRGAATVFVANAGDCRCVIHHKEIDATQVTVDHSPALPHETRRVQKAGGVVKYGRIEERLSVSRGFGDRRFKVPKYLVSATPDIFSFTAIPGVDFIILACDGIWNWITNEQAVRFIKRGLREGRPLDWICRDLVRFAYDAGSTDNITVIIVKLRFGSSSKATGTPESSKLRIKKEFSDEHLFPEEKKSSKSSSKRENKVEKKDSNKENRKSSKSSPKEDKSSPEAVTKSSKKKKATEEAEKHKKDESSSSSSSAEQQEEEAPPAKPPKKRPSTQPVSKKDTEADIDDKKKQKQKKKEKESSKDNSEAESQGSST